MSTITKEGKIYQEPLVGWKLFLFMLGIMICGALVSLDYTITNAALEYIAGGVNASVNNASWFIVAFSIGNAIALSISGFLSQKFGTVKIVYLSLLLYLIFSFFCGISKNLVSLVFSRFGQGFVGGPLIPVAQTLLLLHTPVRFRNLAICIWGLVLIIAPVSAPTIGAFLGERSNWSLSFHINIPLALLALAILRPILKNRETKTYQRRFDLAGFLWLSIFVITLQCILTKGQQWDWWHSNLIRLLVGISLISLAILVYVEIGKKEPLVNFRVFSNLSFSLGTLMSSIAYMTLFSSVTVIPVWLEKGLGYTPLWAGLATLPSGLLGIVLTFALPFLMQKMRKSVITAICFFFFFLSFYWMMQFNTLVDFRTIFLTRFLFSAGIVYNTSLIALTFSDVTKEKMASASGIFYFLRVFSGAIGAAVFSTIWQRRTIFHHERIVENVQLIREPVKEALGVLKHLGLDWGQQLKILNTSVDDQATMLAMNDVTLISAFACVGLIALVLFLGQVRAVLLRRRRKLRI